MTLTYPFGPSQEGVGRVLALHQVARAATRHAVPRQVSLGAVDAVDARGRGAPAVGARTSEQAQSKIGAEVERDVPVSGVASILAEATTERRILRWGGQHGSRTLPHASNLREKVVVRCRALGSVAVPAAGDDVVREVSVVGVDTVDAVEPEGAVCAPSMPDATGRASAVVAGTLEQPDGLILLKRPAQSLFPGRPAVLAEHGIATRTPVLGLHQLAFQATATGRRTQIPSDDLHAGATVTAANSTHRIPTTPSAFLDYQEAPEPTSGPTFKPIDGPDPKLAAQPCDGAGPHAQPGCDGARGESLVDVEFTKNVGRDFWLGQRTISP